MRKVQARGGRRGSRPFRYENVRQTHCDYDSLVQEIWQSESGREGLEGVVHALTAIQSGFGSWGACEFGNIEKKVKKLQKQLEWLRAASIGRGPNTEELRVAAHLQEVLRQ